MIKKLCVSYLSGDALSVSGLELIAGQLIARNYWESVVMENELRQFERVDKNFSIEISMITYPLPKDAEEEGVCKNISCGGICFTVPRPYPPESLLSLKMRITGFDEYKKPYSRLIDIADQKPLTAIGQVVWCSKTSDSDYDIGVRFVNIYKDDYRALQKYLNNGKGTHSK